MKKIAIIFIIFCLIFVNISIAEQVNNISNKQKKTIINQKDDDYGLQWAMNYGRDNWYGARYEGPQPIGDTDNDGLNEFLISGRDFHIRVMEWDTQQNTYLENFLLHVPEIYVDEENGRCDAGGMAIGDLTGDGLNEIAATWYASVYKWDNNNYKIIGTNPWIFLNGGGNGDCYIGDYDNDGQNELIMSGGPITRESTMPELVIFSYNGLPLLQKETVWDNTVSDTYTYIYMAGMGDCDNDGENEIVCGSAGNVYLLDWNKQKKEFDTTILKTSQTWQSYPFACVCRDSDMDGKIEIHVGYSSPSISIFKYNDGSYEEIFEKTWTDEQGVIEALDVGDVNNDGINEVCVGTNLVHILKYNGDTYIEENTLQTYGYLAVLNIGDTDNDGINEIHAANVGIDDETDEEYMYWIYKYGIEDQVILEKPQNQKTGNLEITVMDNKNQPLNLATIGAWNLETKLWYDIQPDYNQNGKYEKNNLPIGQYFVRAVVDGYNTQDTTLEINEDETTSYTFSIEPKIKTTKSKSLLQTFLDKILILFQKIIPNLFFR